MGLWNQWWRWKNGSCNVPTTVTKNSRWFYCATGAQLLTPIWLCQGAALLMPAAFKPPCSNTQHDPDTSEVWEIWKHTLMQPIATTICMHAKMYHSVVDRMYFFHHYCMAHQHIAHDIHLHWQWVPKTSQRSLFSYKKAPTYVHQYQYH